MRHQFSTNDGALLARLLVKLETNIMAQLDDLKAALMAEDADIDQVLQLVANDVAKIADLQAQLAAAAPADMSAQIADIQAQTAKLAAALPPPAAPAPAPAA